MKKSIKIISIVVLLMIMSLFILRRINLSEIDDVSPEIECSAINRYNPDVLNIIPYYNKNPISKNKTWCRDILSLNKTLSLHGISHEYNEFLEKDISQEQLNLAIKEFENCFGFRPEMFKSPQLKISKENKKLIKSNNLILKGSLNQLIRKVYHCGEYGKEKNWIINLF